MLLRRIRETVTEEIFVSQVLYDNADSESHSSVNNDPYSRPKTRRKNADLVRSKSLKGADANDDEQNNIVEESTSLERLQQKLNTISEQTESEFSSSSEEKVTVEPDEDVTMQTSDNETVDTTTQTVKISKELSFGETIKVDVNEPQQIKTPMNLAIQNLPPIDIRADFVFQTIYNISIDSEGKTHIHYHSKAKNVAYCE
ncbi:hypothetical protein NQ317_011206, partial [Molorchus minor]